MNTHTTHQCSWAKNFFPNQALAMMAWILAWCVRERGWIKPFQKRLQQSSSDRSGDAIWRVFCSLADIKLTKREHIPTRCRICPEWIAKEWSHEELLSDVVPMMLQLLIQPTTELLAEAAKFLKRKRAPPPTAKSKNAVGMMRSAYPPEHLIRSLYLASGTCEPGEEFVVMGEGFTHSHIKTLRALGFQNMKDINSLLPPNMHMTPRVLAYYVCKAKILASA